MKLFLRSILLFTIANFTSHAAAQTLTYTGAAGDGQFDTAGNYTPMETPNGATSILISIPATLALPATPTSVGIINIQAATVSLNSSSSTFNPSAIVVNDGATLNLNIAGGGQITTNSTTVSDFIGDGVGSGVLNLTGSGTLTTTNESPGVGFGGTGTFNQSGSTTVNVQGTLGIGADGNVSSPSSFPPNSTVAAGGIGTYNLSGSASLSASGIFVGIGSGTGGGAMTGGSTATSGLLNMSGGTLTTAELQLGVGVGQTNTPVTQVANVSGAVSQSGGTATITTLDIGETSGATGSYAISGAAGLTTTTVTIGDQAGTIGTFQQTGGTVNVAGNLIVGNLGEGSYLLQGGSLTTAAGHNLTLGNMLGGNGVLTESGGAALTVNGTLVIGNAGSGTFNYDGGTLTLANGVTIGTGGTFNQDSSLMLAHPVTVAAGGAYNLNAGTLTTAGTTFTGGGNFNFLGGTVAVTAAPFNDALNGAIVGTSTIDTTGGNATLSGTLSGNGTLDVVGGGTVNLTGTNIGSSFGAQISGAGTTLNVASVNSLSTSGTFSIGTGSTLSLGSSGAAVDTFGGTITGSGNFITGANDVGANTLVLTGNTYLTGTTTIGAGGNGALEVDQGTISNVNGSAGNAADTFNVGNGSTTGTVTLLGTNTIPQVMVATGSTLFAADVTGSINNAGTLGTLGSFNAPSTLTLTNNLTSTNTLLVNTNGTAADQYNAGSANLSNFIQVKGVGSNTYIIVNTGAGITIGGNGMLNNPGGLTTNSPTGLFSATLSENGADTQLLLTTVQGTLRPFAQTPNQAAVAGALDPLIVAGFPFPSAFTGLLLNLNQLSASQIPGALESLTPESLQYARNIAFENSTFMVERVNGALANLRNGYTGIDTSGLTMVNQGLDTSLGRSLGSLLAYDTPAYHPAAPNGVNYYPGGAGSDESSSSSSSSSSSPTWNSSSQVISDSPNPYLATSSPSSKETPAFSEFIAGDVVLADLNQNPGSGNAPFSKATYTAGSATAGVSFRMNSHLAAGVLLDYNHTDAKTDSNSSKTKVDSYSPGIFATYFNHGFYANGIFSFGYNNYSNTRNIPVLDTSAHSSPSGQQYVSDLDFGYDFQPDKHWILGPTLGVTYTHLDVDSFSESGAGPADLNVNSQSADSLRSRLGGHVIFQTSTGDVLLQPNLTLMWQHEYLDNSSGITSSFNIPGTDPFTIQTASPGKDSALVGIGMTATLNNSLSLYFNYLADVGATDYFAQSIVAGIKARF